MGNSCGVAAPQGNGAAVTHVAPAHDVPEESGGAPPSTHRPEHLRKSLSARASPEQVLLSLLAGNERVLQGASAHPHQDLRRVQEVSDQQKPLAAILGCADSRAPAEIIFDQGFGDVFVCRVAGNIATPEELASLEYAVLELGVRVVMVLGHTKCGAVKAALSGKAFPGFIDTLVEHLDVAIARADHLRLEAHRAVKNGDADMLDKVVVENVKYQVQRCARSLLIQEALQKQQLLLVGAVYHLDTGRVSVIVKKGAREEQEE